MAEVNSEEIELESAWAWKCPKCGNRNYSDAAEYVPESAAEATEIARKLGMIEPRQELENAGEGSFLKQPDCVVCGGCFERFPVAKES